MDDGKTREALFTLGRGLEALRVLNHHPLLTAQGLARKLGVSRTSARRTLDTLVEAGVADKAPGDSQYRLAPGAADLSVGLTPDMIMAHIATPLLHAMTERLGWTVSLVSLIDTEVVLHVTTARSASYAITAFPVGNILPLTGSQAGQMMLAFLPDHERRALEVRAGIWRLGEEEAEQIRQHRYYAPVELGEREMHLYVPVLMPRAQPACLILRYLVSAVPRQRLVEQYVPELLDLAGQITAAAERDMRARVPRWLRPYPS